MHNFVSTIIVNCVISLGLVWLLLSSGVLAQDQPAPPETSAETAGTEAVAAALGTAFTYQGRLEEDGLPANGSYDFQFSLYDEPAAGSQFGATVAQTLPVSDGYFSTTLDFGASAFNGEARYLEIAVQPAGGGGFTTLTPRQPLTPNPHALALPGLWTQQNGTSPNLIGGYAGNVVETGVLGSVIGGGGDSGTFNRVWDNYGTIGGGGGNVAGSGDRFTTSQRFATVGGGESNTASGLAATVGGGSYNAADASYATIAGGGPYYAGTGNRVYDDFGTIGGGRGNEVGSNDGDSSNQTSATVSGGELNTAGGFAATVGGGSLNFANSTSATVGGGAFNVANTLYSTVGGGSSNEADGESATVGGGKNNTASGNYATIPGGYDAHASHFGELANASGSFGETGDAQTSLYVLRGRSLVGEGELYLDGISERITLAANKVVAFDILIVAGGEPDGYWYSEDSAGYQVTGVIENVGGTTSFVGAPSVTVLGEDEVGWEVQVIADDTFDALRIIGGGVNLPDWIRWVASVRTVELTR